MKNSIKFLTILFVFGMSLQVFSQEMPRKIKALGLDITLDNEARYIIGKEIDNLSFNRKYLDAMVTKMSLYLPLIERELAAEEVPDDFKYLCIQESALNPDAVSSSNAVGFWQFKYDTGVEVGLTINNQVDERKNIIASTRGAAIYLTRNNLIMKNWLSTLLSHRLGLSGAKAIIPSEWYNSNNITVKGQNDWYILRFLAYQFVLSKEYSMMRKSDNVLYEYKLGRGKPIKQIAAELNVPATDLKAYNAWLLTETIPNDKDYSLLVYTSKQNTGDIDSKIAQKKANTAPVAMEGFDTGFPELKLLTANAKEGEAVLYEINGKKGILAVEGDTPAIIANRGDISLRKFMKFNDLEDEKSPILIGRVYYLKKKAKKAKVVYHVVKEGETLWDISQMYGIRLEYLMEKNRIETVQRLQKGRLMWLMETRPEKTAIEYVLPPQKSNPDKDKPKKTDPIVVTKDIIIPKEEQKKEESTKIEVPKEETTVTISTSDTTSVFVREPAKTPDPVFESKPTKTTVAKTHVVQHGETFFSISQKYGMTIAQLREWNGLSKNSTLTSGAVLKVTGDEPVASTSNTTTAKPTRIFVEEEKSTPDTKVQPASQKISYYVVKPGETAFRVSQINNVSVDDLARWNNLKNYNVFVGQRLIIKK